MPVLSKQSQDELNTCDLELQTLFNHAIQLIDFKVLKGHRGQAEQDAAYAAGHSKLKFPNSKHNSIPSQAVDAKPVATDIYSFDYFAGFIKGIAAFLKSTGEIKKDIRWGGDWDMDTNLKNNKFNDLYHFELHGG